MLGAGPTDYCTAFSRIGWSPPGTLAWPSCFLASSSDSGVPYPAMFKKLASTVTSLFCHSRRTRRQFLLSLWFFYTLLLTTVLFLLLLRTGWGRLPMPPWSDGTGNRPTNCAGCERAVGVDASKVLTCAFSRTGFAFKSGI